MAATIRSSATYASAASETSSTVPLPPGWQPGDVVWIGWELTAATGSVNANADWPKVVIDFHSAASTSATHGVVRRVMQAGDTNPVLVHTSGRFVAIPVAVQGVDLATPEDVTPAFDDNAGVVAPSVRGPSATPAAAASLGLFFFAARNNTNGQATTFIPDGALTEQDDVSSAVAAASNAAIELAYAALVGTSPTGTKTAIASSSTIQSMGSTIIVRPAAVSVADGATVRVDGSETRWDIGAPDKRWRIDGPRGDRFDVEP